LVHISREEFLQGGGILLLASSRIALDKFPESGIIPGRRRLHGEEENCNAEGEHA
jgi:hypothetical protein